MTQITRSLTVLAAGQAKGWRFVHIVFCPKTRCHQLPHNEQLHVFHSARAGRAVHRSWTLDKRRWHRRNRQPRLGQTLAFVQRAMVQGVEDLMRRHRSIRTHAHIGKHI